ncbi:glycerophosphodiester phosphodiesterase [Peribacillus sp. SCS-155]|uniref:glycerophosphodiester phosphodiesterase n=1 Tax=Peribacillus sedimenti TaxID=3115297 RepID=UPI003906741A
MFERNLFMAQTIIDRNKGRINSKWIILSVLTLCLLFFLLCNLYPVQKVNQKKFFQNGRPLVIAHQGGELLAPSNTMAAFQNAADLGVDVLETDIHITKDGHLVAIHDPSVDRTTNGTGKVSDFTLEEIQTLDAGYHFKDLQGQYSYRGKGVYIPTVEEMFREFPDMRIEIEIKDDNPPKRIEEMASKLWDLIEEYHMEHKVLIASFDQDILRTFEKYSKGKTAMVAGKQEVTRFVIFHKIFLPNLYSPDVDAFQVPTEESIFDLTDGNLIRGAHRRGLQMHYWTIDDPKTMEKLLKSGADGILTNRPDLLLELMNKTK